MAGRGAASQIFGVELEAHLTDQVGKIGGGDVPHVLAAANAILCTRTVTLLHPAGDADEERPAKRDSLKEDL